MRQRQAHPVNPYVSKAGLWPSSEQRQLGLLNYCLQFSLVMILQDYMKYCRLRIGFLFFAMFYDVLPCGT